MTLKTRTITNEVVDYHDFEVFVRETLGVANYSFPAVQECGNDTDHAFSVSAEMSEFDQKTFNDWINSNGTEWISNWEILDGLCQRGHIAPGNYLIRVSW